MALVSEWQDAQAELPDGWVEARIHVALEHPGHTDRAVALLAPLQPLRPGPDTIAVLIARDGGGHSPEAFRRALARLDDERLHGLLTIASVEEKAATPKTTVQPSLPESWDAALATLPSDWSDLLGEIELASSDYLEPGALRMAPMNPRRVEKTLRLQFRSASSFGYGASPGMVRRCFERCDADGMRGTVTVLRVLSDTRPVGTQGPVWQIDGRMV
jgi:hypothetical protein